MSEHLPTQQHVYHKLACQLSIIYKHLSITRKFLIIIGANKETLVIESAQMFASQSVNFFF